MYDIINSDQNVNDIEHSIISIGKEIYYKGCEEAIRGCVVIVILTNNIILSESYSDELLKNISGTR